MNEALAALLFFMPAGISNMSPVFAKRIPGLNRLSAPIDGGKTYKGVRVLGANKTWRGLLFGTLTGAISGLLIYRFAESQMQPYVTDTVEAALLGMLLGFGALLGDAVESFFKRQKGVRSGDAWFPFDQTDYIIGGLVLAYPLAQPSTEIMLFVFVIYFGLHLVFTYLGYLLGLKDKPI